MQAEPSPVFTSYEFLAGCAAWNDDEPFVAHEQWEALWFRCQGRERTFVQGLIQLAAALVKIERDNRRGAFSLVKKGANNLEGKIAAPEWIAIWLIEYERWKAAFTEETSLTQWRAERPRWRIPNPG